MARTWLSVTVELLGGRGVDLWPPPGRVFAVGPSHTFLELADAINAAFARWDRSHVSLFRLADGTEIADRWTALDTAPGIGQPMVATADIASTKAARMLTLGAEFQFTFDLGDDWVHRCVVGAKKIDPMEELGILPRAPLPYWGWGSIPDQYGRRWADDDGTGGIPTRPSRQHPMLLHAWPGTEAAPEIDMIAVREAIAARDAGAFLDALAGREIDDALQQVGAGIAMAVDERPQEAEPAAVSVITRLHARGWAGDRVLAEDLMARLAGGPPTDPQVPVDLDFLSILLEGDSDVRTGVVVDLHTGEVHGDEQTDARLVGEDAAIDVDAEPERWVRLRCSGSRDGWEDMAAFAERQHDLELGQRLAKAIEGRGAFRRFRDAVHEEGVAEAWDVFSTDRQWGRAREALADAGFRVA